MSAEAIAGFQRGIVFASDPSTTALPDLSTLEPALTEVEFTYLDAHDLACLFGSRSQTSVDWENAIDWLRQQRFDVAVILTAVGQSPYLLGYLCYLAGIPVRIGRSREFGGQVLTHCLSPE